MYQRMEITEADIIEQAKVGFQVPDLVQKLIRRKVIANTARKAGLRIEADKLQQAADQFRLFNGLNNAEATWIYLHERGLDLAQFERSVHDNTLAMLVAEHLFEDQIEPYFYARQVDYARAAVYEIVLDDAELALELYYAISEGEMSFHQAARRYITDADLRRAGGYRGVLRRKDLRPEVAAAVFATESQSLLKPIKSIGGTHLVMIEEIIEPVLDQELRMTIMAELFADWLDKETSKIEPQLNLSQSKGVA